MNLKKIIIIITLILCSGCNAKYKIEFNDETINESLSVTVEKEMTKEEYRNSYENTISAIGKKNFYKFDIKEKNNKVTLTYSYEFTTENYRNSYIANNCFETFKMLSDDEKYYILGQGSFKCLYYKYAEIDKLDIIVETNHKLIETNADEENKNEYIWHIGKNDYEKEIKLILSKETIKPNIIEKYENVIKITGISIGVIATAILVLFINYKRINKI